MLSHVNLLHVISFSMVIYLSQIKFIPTLPTLLLSVFIYFALIFNYIICLACLNFHLKWTNKQSNMALSLLDQLLRSTRNQNSSAVGEVLQIVFLPKHESTPYRESILFEAVLRVKIFELTMKENVVRRFTLHWNKEASDTYAGKAYYVVQLYASSRHGKNPSAYMSLPFLWSLLPHWSFLTQMPIKVVRLMRVS